MCRVLLVRHGETDWNRNDRIQGWTDISLNDRGREQAAAAAQCLADRYPDIGRLVSSDLPRAVETATAIADREAFEGLSVEYDPVWRERCFGVYQGHEGDRFFAEYPQFAMLDGEDGAKGNVPEEGESYWQFCERALRAWRSLVEDCEGTVVVVTHSGVIRAIVAAVERESIDAVFAEYSVENGSITEFDVGSRPELGWINHVDHLESVE